LKERKLQLKFKRNKRVVAPLSDDVAPLSDDTVKEVEVMYLNNGSGITIAFGEKVVKGNIEKYVEMVNKCELYFFNKLKKIKGAKGLTDLTKKSPRLVKRTKESVVIPIFEKIGIIFFKEKVAGYVRITDLHNIVIDTLFISKKYRGRGIAKKSMEMIEGVYRQKGKKSIQLITISGEGNNLFEDLGYDKVFIRRSKIL